jgi:hypothetical protein
VPQGLHVVFSVPVAPINIPCSIDFSDGGKILGLAGHTLMLSHRLAMFTEKIRRLQRMLRLPAEQALFND